MSELVTGLHPKIMDAFSATITEAKARKLNVALHSGLRTVEAQEKLYALGRTVINPDGKSEKKPMGDIITNAKAYESWHSFGLAGDLVFKTDKGAWSWNKPTEDWMELGAIGEMFGLEWGGHWTRFPDYPHFQMRGEIKNILEAKTILLTKGLDTLWKLV